MGVSTNLGVVLGPALASVLGATIYGEVLPVFAALGRETPDRSAGRRTGTAKKLNPPFRVQRPLMGAMTTVTTPAKKTGIGLSYLGSAPGQHGVDTQTRGGQAQ